jgi:hypothetical protein
VLVDGSAVEVFANDGAEVFASRWFCPQKESLAVANTFAHGGSLWPMEDVMGKEYAFAKEKGLAPDLAMPGWNETVPH